MWLQTLKFHQESFLLFELLEFLFGMPLISHNHIQILKFSLKRDRKKNKQNNKNPAALISIRFHCIVGDLSHAFQTASKPMNFQEPISTLCTLTVINVK